VGCFGGGDTAMGLCNRQPISSRREKRVCALSSVTKKTCLVSRKEVTNANRRRWCSSSLIVNPIEIIGDGKVEAALRLVERPNG